MKLCDFGLHKLLGCRCSTCLRLKSSNLSPGTCQRVLAPVAIACRGAHDYLVHCFQSHYELFN